MKDRLKRKWQWWKSIAEKIGNFQSRLILTIFYFTIAMPFALGIKFLADPLRLKPKKISLKASFWIPREDKKVSLEDLWKQS